MCAPARVAEVPGNGSRRAVDSYWDSGSAALPADFPVPPAILAVVARRNAAEYDLQ